MQNFRPTYASPESRALNAAIIRVWAQSLASSVGAGGLLGRHLIVDDRRKRDEPARTESLADADYAEVETRTLANFNVEGATTGRWYGGPKITDTDEAALAKAEAKRQRKAAKRLGR